MKNIYYQIWIDGILRIKSHPQNKDSWKLLSFNLVTMAMSLNLYLIHFILISLGIKNIPLTVHLDLFPGTKLDSLISFLLDSYIPFGLLNYFLIFHKNRYMKLIEKYEYKGGRLFIIYFFGSLGALVLFFVVAFLLWKLGWVE